MTIFYQKMVQLIENIPSTVDDVKYETEVSVVMTGELSQLNNPKTTYFEGRLIANLEE